jgi:hypothetical protein
MPDDQKPPSHEPAPIPEALIRELEGEAWHVAALAQIMAQTMRLWVDPESVPPFLQEHRRAPTPPWPGMTGDEAREQARGVLESLTQARAILEGASSPEARDQRSLVRVVEAIEEEMGRAGTVLPGQFSLVADAILPDFRYRVSESTWEALKKPKNRELLGQAAAIKAKIVRPEPPRRGQPRARRARWLEPLYLVALDAGLTTAKDAASWGGTLSYLGILPGKVGR